MPMARTLGPRPPRSAERPVTRSRSGKDEMAVAELVPEVALGDRLAVAAVEEPGARGGLEQAQVRRLGLVPAREQGVDRAQPALGRDDEVGPSGAGAHPAVGA